MSLSREARIGLLVTSAVIIFFVGFYFLKGANLFSGENEYYCFYDNVQGLQTSSNVQIRGLNVGRVSHTQLVDGKGVRVVLAISKKIKLPRGTIANLVSSDLLGTKIIRLDLGNGTEIVENGESLPAKVEGGALDNISAEVSPLLRTITIAVTHLDSVLISVNSIFNDDTRQALTGSIASLDSTTHNFATVSKALSQESGEIKSIVHNANDITGNLARNNDNITHILDNAANATEQLSKAPIQKTFGDLEKAAGDLQNVINKINSEQGSLGMLVNNKELYTNLNSSLNSLNQLMADIKAHPSRYINVTVFGKKKE
ncbi:MAG TPA: MlaD family protein [Flavipsychrobacter sp.]|nr:MlaD family protein [Flavipsychrobacter sp.]